MNLKLFARALVIKAKNKRIRYKGIMKAYISLFIVVILIVTSTTAWFTSSGSISIGTQAYKMWGITDGWVADSGMLNSTEIYIDNFMLDEASSVDGRNIYFPTSLTDSTNTDEMFFRNANASDKNVRYAYVSDIIPGNSKDTDVYIKSYKIEVGSYTYTDELRINGNYTNQQFNPSCPIRLAIITDSGTTPRLFDPSAIVNDYAESTQAVYCINQEGQPLTVKTHAESFSAYYYGTNNPIFTIPHDTDITFTLVAWLESTHPNAQDFMGETLTIEFEIESNISKMEMIYLHDFTIQDGATGVTKENYLNSTYQNAGHWLNNDGTIMTLAYKTIDGKTKTTVMTPMVAGSRGSHGETVYQAAMPADITTNISFYRLCSNKDTIPSGSNPHPVDKGTVYNSWHTYSGINSKLNNSDVISWKNTFGNMAESRGSYVDYYAIRGNGYGYVSNDPGDANYSQRFSRWLAPCIGYWGTSTTPRFPSM